MSALVLLRPWWLVLLPALLLLGLWLRRRGGAAGGWERVMPPAMLAAMRHVGHFGGEAARTGLSAIAAAGLLVVGLAGPAVPRTDAPEVAGTGALLIALDLSPSVAEGPALADAKAAAAEILAAVRSRPIGLILYAGEAFEVAAPTADPAVLESDIAVLGPQIMPGGGSRPAAALALARAMLSGIDGADVVLISDGGGMDGALAAEADRLRGDGIGLAVLTLAGSAGGTADAAALAGLADASAPARAPDPVLDRLSSGGGLAVDDDLAALRFHDLGPVVAAFALLPVLALFRRRA